MLKALELNNKELKGRNMQVDFDLGAPKQGYKFRSEKPSKFNQEYQDVTKKALQRKRKRSADKPGNNINNK
jgi:hypothetical protein